MPRISDLPLTTSVDEATALIAVSSNGTTYKITPANLLASSGVGVSFYDSDSSHLITLAGGSNLSANRTLTLTTGDSNRTLDISAGDTTISAFAITILDDANAAAVRSTLGLGSMALETATDYLTVASAVSGYQPLDADLTTLAASITAFGHSLVDDTNAAAARTTLGLGTAAVENIGTSGATLPFLNGTNTWSGINEFSTTTSGIANVLVTCVNDDAVAGPFVTVYRNSASPAVNDQLGTFSFDGKDSAGNYQNYALMRVLISSPTSGSESALFNFVTTQSGTFASRVRIGGGLYTTNATGGDLGADTINANTLYEGGTSLAAKYQGLDSELTALAGLTSAADRLPYFTGSGTAALATFTTAGRNLVDDADASAQRTTLGLGTAATQNTGTSGANVPLLDGANTWSGNQIIQKAAANMQVRATSGDGTHYVAAISGNAATIRWSTWTGSAISDRWLFGKDNTAESGADAGSNFACYNYTDAGAFKAVAFTMLRSDNSVNWYGGLYSNGVTGGSKGAGTVNFATLYENGTSLASKYARLGAANTFTNPQRLPSYTVAGLPAGAAGDIAFTSNGRKNGEGAGAGTGVLVFHDGTAWRACDTGATVAA